MDAWANNRTAVVRRKPDRIVRATSLAGSSPQARGGQPRANQYDLEHGPVNGCSSLFGMGCVDIADIARVEDRRQNGEGPIQCPLAADVPKDEQVVLGRTHQEDQGQAREKARGKYCEGVGVEGHRQAAPAVAVATAGGAVDYGCRRMAVKVLVSAVTGSTESWVFAFSTWAR